MSIKELGSNSSSSSEGSDNERSTIRDLVVKLYTMLGTQFLGKLRPGQIAVGPASTC
jgi:hypothetical protein